MESMVSKNWDHGVITRWRSQWSFACSSDIQWPCRARTLTWPCLPFPIFYLPWGLVFYMYICCLFHWFDVLCGHRPVDIESGAIVICCSTGVLFEKICLVSGYAIIMHGYIYIYVFIKSNKNTKWLLCFLLLWLQSLPDCWTDWLSWP
jgi:hypothetical protein